MIQPKSDKPPEAQSAKVQLEQQSESEEEKSKRQAKDFEDRVTAVEEAVLE